MKEGLESGRGEVASVVLRMGSRVGSMTLVSPQSPYLGERNAMLVEVNCRPCWSQPVYNFYGARVFNLLFGLSA